MSKQRMNTNTPRPGLIFGLILCALFSFALVSLPGVSGIGVGILYGLGYIWLVLAILVGSDVLFKEHSDE